MDKLKLAHDYFMKHVNTDQYRHFDDEVLVLWSFDYVDAMQAEAEKRVNKERPDVLKEELQPDWSQAPEWANWWAIRQGGNNALWCVNKPTVTEDCFLSHGGCSPAPSFGFTGSHIVERPNGL